MPQRYVRCGAAIRVCLALFMLGCCSPAFAQDARQILDATGVKGGLIVHLGCGDGKLTAALRRNESTVVHGLDTDAKNVEQARKHIQSLGLYGKVSVDQHEGTRLPYIDNLVNLVVCEYADDRVSESLMSEIMRVLAPNGVAYVKKNGEWTKTVKPRPKNIDEWTHYLRDASNNAVAQDTVVDFPYHIQWVGAPKYSRSHEFLTSITGMVSSNGRLIYIADEGSTALHRYLPAKWSLIARDAFSGVELWRRPIAAWQPFSQKGRIPFPPDLHRRLVAVGDTVYVTLDIFAPVTALDAATGKEIRTYADTKQCEEIVCDKGVLYCVIGLDAPSKIDRRTLADKRETPARKRLMAIRADTGEALWRKEDADMAGLFHLTLAVQGDRLVFANAADIICLNAATGSERWRHPRPNTYARSAWSTPTVVIHDDIVLCADRLPSAPDVPKTRVVNAELLALSAESGEKLWSRPCAEGVREPVDIFVIDGTVWLGEQPSRQKADFRASYDLRTGEVRKQSGSADGWPTWHHHRCYREKATTRYILAGRTGVEFVDLNTGEIVPHQWIRGICRYGVLPCNGLLYLPPDQCACYIQSRLCGFHVLAPKRQSRADAGSEVRNQRTEEVQKGPAYGAVPHSVPRRRGIRTPHSEDWPTFRHDAQRSAFTPSAVPADLKQAWQADLGGRLSTLVSADGKVFVCRPDAHEVIALDAESGKVLWRFTAGGRVDSPPTIAQGIAVFGSRDGHVYALRADDGRLIWRFRAAPEDDRLVAYDQVESVWPVHGSTLVEDGAVYVAAGRSSYVDGGVCLHKLDLATGKPLQTKCYYSRDPETGRRVELFKPFRGKMQPEQEMPGLHPGIFSSDGSDVYLRGVALTRDLEMIGMGKPHLFCSMGLLDDASWERTYWLYGTHMYSGCIGWQYAKKLEPAGRIIAFDDARAYAFRDVTFRPFGLCAVAKVPKHIPPPPPKKKPKQKKKRRRGRDPNWRKIKFTHDWLVDIPVYVRAMVLAKDTLFICGPPRFAERDAYMALRALQLDTVKLPDLLADAAASMEGKKGSLLWAVNKADGQKLTETKLDVMPVFDGMIAAGGRLYMSTIDGKVVCLTGKR